MCVASECDAKDLAVILTKSKLIIVLLLNDKTCVLITGIMLFTSNIWK